MGSSLKNVCKKKKKQNKKKKPLLCNRLILLFQKILLTVIDSLIDHKCVYPN